MDKDITLTKKEEAELVAEHLRELLKRYGNVSLQDFNDLVGLPSTHEDHKFGWTKLDNMQVRKVDEGYLLEIGPLEEI